MITLEEPERHAPLLGNLLKVYGDGLRVDQAEAAQGDRNVLRETLVELLVVVDDGELLDNLLGEGRHDVATDRLHGHLANAPAGVVAHWQVIVRRVHVLITVVQVQNGAPDKLRQLILAAVGQVFLQVSNHTENVLVDALVIELQHLYQNVD